MNRRVTFGLDIAALEVKTGVPVVYETIVFKNEKGPVLAV